MSAARSMHFSMSRKWRCRNCQKEYVETTIRRRCCVGSLSRGEVAPACFTWPAAAARATAVLARTTPVEVDLRNCLRFMLVLPLRIYPDSDAGESFEHTTGHRYLEFAASVYLHHDQ